MAPEGPGSPPAPRLRGEGEAHAGEEPKPPPAALVVGINLLLDREVFIGDELTLITLSPDGGDALLEPFLVVGGFKSGEFETDSRTALARLGRVQNFLHLFVPPQDFRVEGIRIALDDYHHAEAVRTDILAALAKASRGRRSRRWPRCSRRSPPASPRRGSPRWPTAWSGESPAETPSPSIR